MPLLKALCESLSIFTPKKSATKKPQIVASKASYNPTTTTADSSLAARLQNQRMSPDARTEEWLRNNSPEKKAVRFENSGTPSVLGVKSSGIKKINTPNSTRTSNKNTAAGSLLHNIASEKKRNQSIWGIFGFGSKTEDKGTPQSGLLAPDDRDIEGSTVVEEEILEDGDTMEGPSNLEGSTLLVQDESGDLKVQKDDESIKEEEEEDFSDFSTEEFFLFHKLNARGHEPIIHLGWAMDFRTLPEVLFTDDRKETYIKHIFAPEYHGKPPTPFYNHPLTS